MKDVPPLPLWQDVKAGAGALYAALSPFSPPSLRIGVTGLSRAGKTVFITALVHGLLTRRRMDGFAPVAGGRVAHVRLVDHPDDALPRFAYETHLAALTAPDRAWPHSTRAISALRLAIEYQSTIAHLGGLFGPAGMIGAGTSRLMLDVVDYPGEWLLDLPLLTKSYAQWSAETLDKARKDARKQPFLPYIAALEGINPHQLAEEGQVQALAAAFTAALRACRAEGLGLSALAPGRFLMPGDLEGAPALTFAPMPPGEGTMPESSLLAVMARRYEAYKAKIVTPFFAEHFARIDRQIVLVDVLSALNEGQEALADLEAALVDVLIAFRIGQNTLMTRLFAPRISRIYFAATKVDHLHHTNHARLEGVLRLLVRRAWHRAQGAGARIDMGVLAAIRATREVGVERKGRVLPCIAGVPEAGQILGEQHFDGKSETALFPGDLPEDVTRLFTGMPPDLKFLRFRPPLLAEGGSFPHIGLDRALDFLLRDDLR